MFWKLAYASRRSSYLVGSIGAFVQVLGVWGIYFCTALGTVDVWWNLPHLTVYVGFAVSVLAIWRGLKAHRIQPATIAPINFVNVAGLKLAGVGSVLETVAFAWSTVTEILFSEFYTSLSFAVLTVGLLAVTLGFVVGLAIEYGLIRREMIATSTLKRWLTLISVLLMFGSIWLTATSFFVYLATSFQSTLVNFVAAVFLALIAPLVLVPARRVLPRFGAALSVGILFSAVCYFFIVGVTHAPSYIPWGLLPVALFDVLVSGLKRVMNMMKAGLVGSMSIGFLFCATYFPFTLSLFAWSFLPGLALAATVLSSLAGALLGSAAFRGLSSAVPGDLAV
jgi:hypothetical protein